jgi:hypothetical protein
MASTATGCLTDKWNHHASVVQSPTTNIATVIEVLCYGRYIVPPQGSFNINAQESVSGGTAIAASNGMKSCSIWEPDSICLLTLPSCPARGVAGAAAVSFGANYARLPVRRPDEKRGRRRAPQGPG